MSQADSLDLVRQVTDDDIKKVEGFSNRKKASVLVVFFDDMKGSTALKQKLTEELDEEAFQTLRREHDDLLTSIITRENAGEVIKSTGDGLLAVFSEPSTAVERAVEIQDKLHGHPYISIRIGMDMGQVRVESAGGVQKDTFGRHVDWAARTTTLADAGHICVTRSVYPDAFGWIHKSQVSWKEHGSWSLKQGESPLEIYEPYNANTTQPMNRLQGNKLETSQPAQRKWRSAHWKFRYAFLSIAIIVIAFAFYMFSTNDKGNVEVKDSNLLEDHKETRESEGKFVNLNILELGQQQVDLLERLKEGAEKIAAEIKEYGVPKRQTIEEQLEMLNKLAETQVEIIDRYLKAGNYDEAIKFVEICPIGEEDNPFFFFASLYSNLKGLSSLRKNLSTLYVLISRAYDKKGDIENKEVFLEKSREVLPGEGED